jgi:uracil-DNA glycosylase
MNSCEPRDKTYKIFVSLHVSPYNNENEKRKRKKKLSRVREAREWQ